jgi:cell division transport system permease protein
MTKPVETMAEPWDDFEGVAPLALAPPAATPIVPNTSIAGRSLAAVVAIMTFLAALTTGAVMLVVSAASDWQSDVGREVTIQVRPAPGRDLEADVRKAAEIARATPGVADVHAYTKQESARLAEPWLGGGLSLDDLPIPRLIVVKLASGVLPDFEALGRALAAQVAGATLDDHRRWIDRMRTMAGTAVAAGVAVLALVLAVTVLGHLRDARRHGDQPPDHRGAALCGRDRRFHRRAVPAPFPAARLQGWRHRRRGGDLLLRRCGSG